MPILEIDCPNANRVETGPIRFGRGWTGLFVRGDDAFALAMDIKWIREVYERLPKEQRMQIGLQMAINHLSGYEKIILEEVVEK